MLKLARVWALVFGAISAGPSAGAGQVTGQGGTVQRALEARPMPGDRIFLHILREPLMSDTVTVDERSEVAFPKLGTINVADMSIGRLVDSLRTAYAAYLRMPELEIVVLRRVIVNGEVMKPNVYYVPTSGTAADAIARAGGFTEAAKRTQIHLIRSGTRSAIANWDRGGAARVELLSGDELIVGRRSWLSLNILPTVSTVLLLASVVIASQ